MPPMGPDGSELLRKRLCHTELFSATRHHSRTQRTITTNQTGAAIMQEEQGSEDGLLAQRLETMRSNFQEVA
jgi:hypothetical protein